MSVMPKSFPHLTFSKWELKASGSLQSLPVSVLLSIKEKSIAASVVIHLKSKHSDVKVRPVAMFWTGASMLEGQKTVTTKVAWWLLFIREDESTKFRMLYPGRIRGSSQTFSWAGLAFLGSFSIPLDKEEFSFMTSMWLDMGVVFSIAVTSSTHRALFQNAGGQREWCVHWDPGNKHTCYSWKDCILTCQNVCQDHC